jgi:glutathione S-transferase
MILYEHPLSPYARKVKLVLFEKGLEFERRQGGPKLLDSDEFRRVGPRGEVPVLVDGALTVADSTIICEYLEERYPEPRLYPVTPAERVRARLLEDMADTEFEPALWALFEVRFFGRAPGELGEKLVAAATGCVERHMNRLEQELADHSFFGGESFGIADAALVPHLGGAAQAGIKAGPERPRLSEWVKRVRARPSVQKDQQHVRELAATLDEEAQAAATRPRQYRSHRLEWMLKYGGLPVVLDGLEQGTIQFSRAL